MFDARPPETAAERCVVIPDRFATVSQYADMWLAAVEEELALRCVCPHMLQLPTRPDRLREPARGMAAAIAQCSTPLQQPTPAALQRALRGYFAEASMQRGFSGPPRARNARDEDHDRQARRFLLLGSSGLQPASAYRKGDLWVVSNRPTLSGGGGGWVAVLRSQWHGPTRDAGKCVLENEQWNTSWITTSSPHCYTSKVYEPVFR